MRPVFLLLLVSLALTLSCSGDGAYFSEEVRVARILPGENQGGACTFRDEISEYPVTYTTNHEACAQVVSIGPLSRGELEEMKRDYPEFWGHSLAYQQALRGERIDGECTFPHPAVKALLEFSEPVSSDEENCLMIVDVGPATQQQLDAVQSLGNTSSEPAVPDPSADSPEQ